MRTNLRGLGSSGLVLTLGAALAWACASGQPDDGDNGIPDSGAPLDAVAADATPAGDDGGNPPGNDADGPDQGDSSSPGDDSAPPQGDDSSAPPGDDSGPSSDDAGTDAGPPDAGHDAGPPDAGHDAGQPSRDAGCGSPAVVVNEVQTTGAASAEDEWVELFNPSSCAVDISGWSLKYLSINGTSKSPLWTAPSGTTLPALGYALVVGTAFSGSQTPIGSLANGLAQAGGGVGLYNASATELDSVGYGAGATNAFVEGSPAGEAAAGQSIARVPNGVDTNDNASDFVVTSPTPGAKN